MLPGAVNSAVVGQCWFSFGTFLRHGIFLQHSLGLVRYTVEIFHTFTPPEVLPILAKPRLFKAKSAQKIQPVTNVLFEKNGFTGGASGSYCAILTIYVYKGLSNMVFLGKTI